MTDPRSLIRLQTWLSPAFPTGAFAYSSGLEVAVDAGIVTNQDDLAEWLRDLISAGPAWNDAVFLAESWRLAAADEELEDIAELADAMSFSAERSLETIAQGSAFRQAARAWGNIPALPESVALPVAVGAVSASQRVELIATLSAYLHAWVSNIIQAAIRLIPLGQQGGVALLASLETSILAMAEKAADSDLDDLGNSTVMADVMAMQHETLNSRIFRS